MKQNVKWSLNVIHQCEITLRNKNVMNIKCLLPISQTFLYTELHSLVQASLINLIYSWHWYSIKAYVLASCGNLTQPTVILEEATSILKMPPCGSYSVVHILDWRLIEEGPADCGQCHPWAGGPGFYRWLHQLIGNKRVNSTSEIALCLHVPALTSLHELQALRQNKSFSPQVDFGHGV